MKKQLLWGRGCLRDDAHDVCVSVCLWGCLCDGDDGGDDDAYATRSMSGSGGMGACPFSQKIEDMKPRSSQTRAVQASPLWQGAQKGARGIGPRNGAGPA